MLKRLRWLPVLACLLIMGQAAYASYPATGGTAPTPTRALGALNPKTSYYASQTTTYASSPFTAANLPATSSWTIEYRLATTQSGTRYAWGSLTTAVLGFNASGFAQAVIACTPSNITITGNSAVTDGKWHSLALECQGASTSTFNLYVDGVKQATGTGVYNPSGTGGAIGGNGGSGNYQGFLEDMRLSTVARYGGSNYTPATATFLNGTANTLCLHHMSGDTLDYAGSADPPILGTCSLSTSGGTDTISYSAATAGTNSIAGYALYVGVTAGGESSIAYATQSVPGQAGQAVYNWASHDNDVYGRKLAAARITWTDGTQTTFPSVDYAPYQLTEAID